jgi:K+-sensing histidine kinase KdpD
MPPNPPLARPHLESLPHDLNTKLTVISVRSELLQRQLRHHGRFSKEQRERFDAGLDEIRPAARFIAARIERLQDDCDCYAQ